MITNISYHYEMFVIRRNYLFENGIIPERVAWGWLRTVFSLLLMVPAAQAQSSLNGTVLDSVTQKPLAFGTVFLANTIPGVTADEVAASRLRGCRRVPTRRWPPTSGMDCADSR